MIKTERKIHVEETHTLFCDFCGAEIKITDGYCGEWDRVVTIELPDVVTNPDDMKGESVTYIGTRKPNAPHHPSGCSGAEPR